MMSHKKFVVSYDITTVFYTRRCYKEFFTYADVLDFLCSIINDTNITFCGLYKLHLDSEGVYE